MTAQINPSQNTGNSNPIPVQILSGYSSTDFKITSPNYLIQFCEDSGKELAKFFINGENKLDFEGNITKSAKKFIGLLKKSFSK